MHVRPPSPVAVAVAAAVSIVSICAFAAAAPAVAGTMTDLGTLPGDEGSAAHAVNLAGDIAGVSASECSSGGPLGGTLHPVLWHAGAIRELPTLGGPAGEAFDLDDFGRVAGRSDGPLVRRRVDGRWRRVPKFVHATLWETDGAGNVTAVRDLDGRTAAGTVSEAFGIGGGVIAGTYYDPAPRPVLFAPNAAGGYDKVFLPMPGTVAGANAAARDVTTGATGRRVAGVVTVFTVAGARERACIWVQSALPPHAWTLRILPTLPYGDAYPSRAEAVNEEYMVVGTSWTWDGLGYVEHAVRWFVDPNGGAIHTLDLGALPPAYPGAPRDSAAYGISPFEGTIAGHSNFASAVTWQPAFSPIAIADLGTLPCGPGIGCQAIARDANDWGDVVGESTFGTGYCKRAFLWQP